MKRLSQGIGLIVLAAMLLPPDASSAEEGVAAVATTAARSLLGSWVGACDAWGTPAECRLEWAEGLHETHVTVRYTIDSREQTARIFEGTGVYRIVGDAMDGYWSDSGGAIHPLKASWANGSLTTHWGVAGIKLGRTVYRLADNGALEVTDWILRDDGWHAFMQVRYLRES